VKPVVDCSASAYSPMVSVCHIIISCSEAMADIMYLCTDLRLGAPAGYFPVVLEALPEGTCVHAHVPVYQVRELLSISLCSMISHKCNHYNCCPSDHSARRVCSSLHIPGDAFDNAVVRQQRRALSLLLSARPLHLVYLFGMRLCCADDIALRAGHSTAVSVRMCHSRDVTESRVAHHKLDVVVT
jgi:hypothetical protein